MNTSTLGSDFAIGTQLFFTQSPEGYIFIEVDTPQATARVSLMGGQIISWHPKSQTDPVLWVSKLAQYIPGKAIRGGVPLCWPWFGAHSTHSQLASHGFARILPWSVVSTSIDTNGVIDIKLKLGEYCNYFELYPSDWPKSVSLSAHYRIGEILEVSLITNNNTEHEIIFTEGLHTYFYVSDVVNARVLGLDGIVFVDLTDGNKRRIQKGPITFEDEIGQIFIDCDKATSIEDRKLGRSIHVVCEGGNSIAVWNPGLKMASKMPDLGNEGWRTMVCVETSNALGNAVRIVPGNSHTIKAIYFVEALA
jgi:glucose-6-phosphate 1-epimerase